MTRFFVAALAGLISFAAHSQSWPTKPIRLLVPFAPGGSSSIVARAVAVEIGRAHV